MTDSLAVKYGRRQIAFQHNRGNETKQDPPKASNNLTPDVNSQQNSFFFLTHTGSKTVEQKVKTKAKLTT